MKISCIIIDDEPLAIKVIENHIEKVKDIVVKKTFTNPVDALSILEEQTIDVIFLDMNMPKMGGLDFLKTIPIKSKVIITTAYREHAVESYSFDVLDYLVKPIPFDRFLKAINKLKQQLHLDNDSKKSSSSQETHIFLRADKKLIRVKYEDILYVKSLRDYVKVCTEIGEYIVHHSLGGILEKLPSRKFIRVHKSYIISIDKIGFIKGSSIEIGNKIIPIGRKYTYAKKMILKKKSN